MYTYKNISTTNLEDIFLSYAIDVNVYLTPEGNKSYFDYVNSIQEALRLDKFESWKDFYTFMAESSLCCDKHLSNVVRLEQIHLFEPDRPTLCWYGCNPTFGTDKRFYGIVPILFSDETKTNFTPVFHTDGDLLFFEFSKDFAKYLFDEQWDYEGEFEFNTLEFVDKPQE